MIAFQRPSATNERVLRPFMARLAIRTALESKQGWSASPHPVSGRLSGCFCAIVESPASHTVTGGARKAMSRTVANKTPRRRVRLGMRESYTGPEPIGRLRCRRLLAPRACLPHASHLAPGRYYATDDARRGITDSLDDGLTVAELGADKTHSAACGDWSHVI